MNSLPKTILQLFWGDDLRQLSWEKHKEYISKTILEKGDKEAVHWLFKNTNKTYLKNLVESQKMDEKSKNFWSIYLS